ncbi:metal-sensing transcriptional repressor (plasmid) [Rhodococcus opacus]
MATTPTPAATETDGHGHGYITEKDAYLKRLSGSRARPAGLQRMVEEDKYCIDILTQVLGDDQGLAGRRDGAARGPPQSLRRRRRRRRRSRGGGEDQRATDAIARLVRS